jgi:pilus assembly protein CpaB
MIVKSSSPDVLGNINGFMSRLAFVRGEPMRLDKLVKGGEAGFMSAVLPAGMRAVAIRIASDGGSTAGGSFCPTIASMWSASIAMTWRRSRAARQA